MRKRNTGQALLDMAEIFPQDHDVNETFKKAVYFPVLKANIRCEGLKPINLLQLFGSDACCDKVIVFLGCWEPAEKASIILSNLLYQKISHGYYGIIIKNHLRKGFCNS